MKISAKVLVLQDEVRQYTRKDGSPASFRNIKVVSTEGGDVLELTADQALGQLQPMQTYGIELELGSNRFGLKATVRNAKILAS